MKTCKHLLLAVGLFFFFSISLSAQLLQAVDYTPAPGDSTVFNIELPALVSKTKFKATPAFYKHLFIFGDGNFLFGESQEKAGFKHLYGPSNSTQVQNYFARAYSTGVYSEPEEPPLMGAPPITPPVSGSITNKTVVDSNRYLKILRNVQVKPGDPFVSILSVKNPNDVPFNGQLFFLYNGRLRTVSKTEVTKLPEFSDFKIRENMFHRPDVGSTTTFHYSKLGPVNTEYKGLLLAEIFNLAPGEEVHYFVDLEGDEAMMDVFEATAKAEMDFAVALGTFSADNGYPVLTPENLQQELSDLGLSTFVGGLAQGILPDSVRLYAQNGDSTVTSSDLFSPQSGAPVILDYYTSTASLVKSHDPNFMIMEACACPAQSDRYQIFTTVQCENTGFGETNNIYMDIKLPTGVSADDIVATPVKYHPYGGPADQISMIKLSDDSIRWELLNFGIEGTPLHGVGDPRTFANVQFHMYSSIEPALLDSIYACIRFDDLSNDPVCTVPVAVSMITADMQNGQVLQCTVGDCADDPAPTSWPWWVWLLLILLAILIIIWLIRRNQPV
jgi:hypothetical protein